ncbi:uncharacterized protein FOMMEDRAFT_158876 [Fomitiporia mediterranea MF3/22]|uniref:uncharacterized protein n=1 Tax=Fomitiporia mediterranea (strain MF3/22) TaxID=694068 RepID=UPI0004408C8B|nr:uncharacterized protein FOMMEDRAFT_158876 [Fomitiporia mediterranea MF3/22]EJD01721.1 hypothetical protein FOMMEDRAFT_158876 [Fomitiporia mediterranea MF3/22]
MGRPGLPILDIEELCFVQDELRFSRMTAQSWVMNSERYDYGNVDTTGICSRKVEWRTVAKQNSERNQRRSDIWQRVHKQASSKHRTAAPARLPQLRPVMTSPSYQSGRHHLSVVRLNRGHGDDSTRWGKGNINRPAFCVHLANRWVVKTRWKTSVLPCCFMHFTNWTFRRFVSCTGLECDTIAERTFRAMARRSATTCDASNPGSPG